MFGSKKRIEAVPPEIIDKAPREFFRPQYLTRPGVSSDSELRPCWVYGKKAIFHRWVNTANPALPKGQEPSENARYFQHRSTQALVEYENGTVARVWPQDVKFADHGLFAAFSWDTVEDSNGPGER